MLSFAVNSLGLCKKDVVSTIPHLAK